MYYPHFSSRRPANEYAPPTRPQTPLRMLLPPSQSGVLAKLIEKIQGSFGAKSFTRGAGTSNKEIFQSITRPSLCYFLHKCFVLFLVSPWLSMAIPNPLSLPVTCPYICRDLPTDFLPGEFSDFPSEAAGLSSGQEGGVL